jgi:solute carrier family 25 phosphate transporter 3
MQTVFPSQQTLNHAFAGYSPFLSRSSESQTKHHSPWLARHELYPAWSAVDDAKNKAAKLSDAAMAEVEKATSKASGSTGKIELYSPTFYAACTFGGVLACGLTHTAVTPLDLVKCRRQVDSKMYKGNFEAWGKIARAEGFRGVYTGWSPTLWGYSVYANPGYKLYVKTSADFVP